MSITCVRCGEPIELSEGQVAELEEVQSQAGTTVKLAHPDCAQDGDTAAVPRRRFVAKVTLHEVFDDDPDREPELLASFAVSEESENLTAGFADLSDALSKQWNDQVFASLAIIDAPLADPLAEADA